MMVKRSIKPTQAT